MREHASGPSGSLLENISKALELNPELFGASVRRGTSSVREPALDPRSRCLVAGSDHDRQFVADGGLLGVRIPGGPVRWCLATRREATRH